MVRFLSKYQNVNIVEFGHITRLHEQTKITSPLCCQDFHQKRNIDKGKQRCCRKQKPLLAALLFSNFVC